MGRLTTFLIKRWPLIYIAAWLWFLVSFLILITVPHDAERIIYYQVMLSRRAIWLLGVIPFGLMVVAAAGFYGRSGNLQATAALMLVPTLFGTCAIPFFGPVIFGSTQLYHLQRTSAEDHVYNLAIVYEVEGSTGDYFYILYECDGFGFRCEERFRHDIQSRFTRPAVGMGHDDGVLWLTLDGETAFEHPLD